MDQIQLTRISWWIRLVVEVDPVAGTGGTANQPTQPGNSGTSGFGFAGGAGAPVGILRQI
jgi:hypothetical protein